MKAARAVPFFCLLLLAAALWAQSDSAMLVTQQQKPTESLPQKSNWFRWDPIALALFGAGIAALFAGIGSAIGCAISGGMAAGALQEKPELFGRFLPLAAAPGTQGVYGFVATVLILEKISPQMTTEAGWQLFFVGIPVGFAGLLSAIWQGKVCASSIALVVKDPSQLGKSLVFPALVEFYAILGLLTSILMLARIG